MSPIYTPGKLILRRTYIGLDDPDAAAYITAVEIADGQPLEIGVQVAIHSFVKGCKADGIWPAIKASCIMAGARTLAGALVPLVGTAPTNFNFVAGDYNRKTGLVGNGTTKYLDSGRNNNADPQDSKHLAVFKSSNAGKLGGLLGTALNANGTSWIFEGFSGGNDTYRVNTNPSIILSLGSYPDTGFIGINRSSSSNSTRRYSGATISDASTSQAPLAANALVFSAAGQPTDARLAYYSIGESLDLALLDARVTALINTFGAVIP
jgi:hypothetical protein